MPLRLGPGISDGWILQTLSNGGVEAQFLGLDHALEWMLLGQARSCPRIDPLWPGQSLHMTCDPGPVGQVLRVGAVCGNGIAPSW
jgi:hypothetical protein